MTTALRFAMLAVAAVVTACASPPPVRFHTLLAPAPSSSVLSLASTATKGPGQAAPFLIDLLAVGIPLQLDQPQLLVRQGDSGVALLENERWAGPLADEVRSALSAQLTRQLGVQDVAGLSAPAGKQVLRIKVQLRRLDAWPGLKVQLDADWSMAFADERNGARLTCGGRFDAAAPGGYPELVQAEQEAVRALSDRIAADARRWAVARTADCQG